MRLSNFSKLTGTPNAVDTECSVSVFELRNEASRRTFTDPRLGRRRVVCIRKLCEPRS
jgi:hypothetical protein